MGNWIPEKDLKIVSRSESATFGQLKIADMTDVIPDNLSVSEIYEIEEATVERINSVYKACEGLNIYGNTKLKKLISDLAYLLIKHGYEGIHEACQNNESLDEKDLRHQINVAYDAAREILS